MARLDSLGFDLTDAKNAVLAENWWALALRGVFAVLFSIAAFAVPVATMLALVLVFAAYSIVDGVFNIVFAVRGARKRERWGLLLLNGLFGIVVGIAAAAWPGITVLAFVLMVAAWAIVSGSLMLFSAFDLKISHGRWIFVFSGIVSLIWGALLIASPVVGALVLTWWAGAYQLVFGCALIFLAFKLRGRRGERNPDALAAST